jgi:hypothetical protein
VLKSARDYNNHPQYAQSKNFWWVSLSPCLSLLLGSEWVMLECHISQYLRASPTTVLTQWVSECVSLKKNIISHIQFFFFFFFLRYSCFQNSTCKTKIGTANRWETSNNNPHIIQDSQYNRVTLLITSGDALLRLESNKCVDSLPSSALFM